MVDAADAFIANHGFAMFVATVMLIGAWVVLRWIGKRVDQFLARHYEFVDVVQQHTVSSEDRQAELNAIYKHLAQGMDRMVALHENPNALFSTARTNSGLIMLASMIKYASESKHEDVNKCLTDINAMLAPVSYLPK